MLVKQARFALGRVILPFLNLTSDGPADGPDLRCVRVHNPTVTAQLKPLNKHNAQLKDATQQSTLLSIRRQLFLKK